MVAPTKTEKKDQVVELKRELGLISAGSMIVGTMIGSGIFVSPTAVLKYSGSVGLCLIIWGIAAVVCLFGALAFAELGAVVPRSGSEYAFFTDSFGPLHKFWGPLPAFFYAFLSVLLIRPCSIAVVILTSAEYLVEFVAHFICFDESFNIFWLKRLIAIIELCTITYINAVSVKLYVKVQNVFTSLKLMACLVVIGGGIYKLSEGEFGNLQTGFENTTASAGGVALAMFNGLFAYGGWATITAVTEEIRNPEKNIFRSILISIPSVAAIYIFMNVSYMTVLTTDEMSSSKAVAIAFGEKILGNFVFVIPLGVTVSAFGCAMALQFSVARVCYAAGQFNHMPHFLSYIQVNRLTPIAAVLLEGFLSIVIVCLGDIIQLIEFQSFLSWIGYSLAMVSLLIYRKTKPDIKRPYKVPVFVPVITILVGIFLCITSVVTDPSYKYLVAGVALILSFIIYTFVIYKRKTVKFSDNISNFVQKLLLISPGDAKTN